MTRRNFFPDLRNLPEENCVNKSAFPHRKRCIIEKFPISSRPWATAWLCPDRSWMLYCQHGLPLAGSGINGVGCPGPNYFNVLTCTTIVPRNPSHRAGFPLCKCSIAGRACLKLNRLLTQPVWSQRGREDYIHVPQCATCLDCPCFAAIVSLFFAVLFQPYHLLDFFFPFRFLFLGGVGPFPYNIPFVSFWVSCSSCSPHWRSLLLIRKCLPSTQTLKKWLNTKHFPALIFGCFSHAWCFFLFGVL